MQYTTTSDISCATLIFLVETRLEITSSYEKKAKKKRMYMTIELSACGLLRIYSGGINIKMRGRYFALQIRMDRACRTLQIGADAI